MAVGLHGLLSQAVQRRTGEIGLRLAVGGDAGECRRDDRRAKRRRSPPSVLSSGLGAAALLARTVRGAMLFGVTPIDPVTYAGAAALVVATAGGASLVAARRASRVEPLVALRANG